MQANSKGGREGQLESELRRSKRREEKLQALLYCLREDVKASGGNLEYALEFPNLNLLCHRLHCAITGFCNC